MAAPCTVVTSGGLPVTESTNGFGMPMTPAVSGLAVTIVAAGGLPVIFIGVDFVLWPGGVDPGTAYDPSLDFSDERNSQYIPII